MAANYEYSWDDEDLIKAYEVAVQLGTRTNRPKKEVSTSTPLDVAGGSGHHAAANCDQSYGNRDGEIVMLENGTKVIYTYFDGDGVPSCDDDETEAAAIGESIYYAGEDGGFEEDPGVPGKGKGKKKKKKGKQVQFTGTESGYQQRQSGWDRTEPAAEDYQEEAEGGYYEEDEGAAYYNPEPTQTPDWTRAFPKLTAPPMPSTIPPAFKKGDMSSLLMSWYMCGYHAGYYDAMEDVKRQAKLKK